MSLPRRPLARRAMKLTGSRSSELEIARGRMVLIGSLFVLAYILIGARVFDLSVIQGVRGDETVLADDMSLRDSAKTAIRGDITDRNGVLLATSLATPSLYADPALITNPEQVARDLVSVLPRLSYGDVLQKLQRHARFVWIRRNLTPQEQYAVLNLGHPGLDFQTEYRRIYPGENLAAHIVGYASVDGEGLAGIERSFDQMLAGGTPVQLTLDVRIQHILRREIAAAVGRFQAKSGAGVVMDLSNGEILAAVSLPDFDPHNPGAHGVAPLFNHLTLGVYELGSTFKIFSTAAMLEEGGGTLASTFDAREPIKVGRFRITDFHPQKRILTLPEVFMYSSNIGAAMMGKELGGDTLRAFYKHLGLLDRMPLEIGETGTPLVPSPWRDITTLTASYGHGIAVTPLQMVAAASGIVTGTRVTPTLVLDEKNRKKEGDVVVSQQTAHRMRQLMRLVVTDGTGTMADVPGYQVGGKTGTAEKSENGGYARHSLISSFMGFFPMSAPRYAVFVMVDEPHGDKKSFGYATAGWTAAPAVGRVVAGMAAVLGIPPQQPQDLTGPLQPYIHTVKAEGGAIASY
jgi:cell division protein FtsI (penicillin-binding protein 3)